MNKWIIDLVQNTDTLVRKLIMLIFSEWSSESG